MKKQAAFVLGVTSNLDYALANVIIGIDKHIKNIDYDIVVYEQGFDEKTKNAVNKIHDTKFVSYKFPVDFNSQNKQFERYTSLSFSIYECFNLLKEYKQVVWLDCDILIKKDFSQIIKTNNGISICPEDGTVGGHLMKNLDEFNMNAREYNSGIVFFSDDIRDYERLANWCYQKTVEYSEFLDCPDQTILSILFDYFNITTRLISHLYNCMPFAKDREDAYIIHTNGVAKPWNSWYFREWEENNKKWEKLIGQKINVQKDPMFVRIMRTVFKNRYNCLKRPRKFVQALFDRNVNNQ